VTTLVEQRPAFDGMRVCILSPISKIEPRWMQSTVNMVAYSWANGLRIYEMGMIYGQVVHWARDELVNQALKVDTNDGPFSHFLFLDSDHVFPPYLACRLANAFINPEVDMCSAVYYARSGSPLPIVFIKHPSREDGKYTHHPIIGIPEQLCQVDAVGFGAVLIRREVLEALPIPRFRFDGCGEDIYFCVNAKAAGFRIFVDGGLRIGHIMEPGVVDFNTFNTYVDTHSDELGDRVKIYMGGNDHGSDVHLQQS
jgi:hypothetical protein